MSNYLIEVDGLLGSMTQQPVQQLTPAGDVQFPVWYKPGSSCTHLLAHLEHSPYSFLLSSYCKICTVRRVFETPQCGNLLNTGVFFFFEMFSELNPARYFFFKLRVL